MNIAVKKIAHWKKLWNDLSSEICYTSIFPWNRVGHIRLYKWNYELYQIFAWLDGRKIPILIIMNHNIGDAFKFDWFVGIYKPIDWQLLLHAHWTQQNGKEHKNKNMAAYYKITWFKTWNIL